MFWLYWGRRDGVWPTAAAFSDHHIPIHDALEGGDRIMSPVLLL